MLLQALIRYFDNFMVAYFLGHRVYCTRDVSIPSCQFSVKISHKGCIV